MTPLPANLDEKGRDVVLVVGTTPDYVDRLAAWRGGGIVFLMDARFAGHPLFRTLPPSSYLFATLDNHDAVSAETRRFFLKNRMTPQGIACFDCEYLILASTVAAAFQKPFPPRDAVARSRNKFAARSIWSKAGVPSPRAMLVSNLAQTLAFFLKQGNDIVLKPLSGSGSELLFRCRSEADVRDAVAIMEDELPKRRSNPLYRPVKSLPGMPPLDPCRQWMAEDFIPGEEFSCDFILQRGKVVILRETGKRKDTGQTFGSVLAYTMPPLYPRGFQKAAFTETLKKAATALGFDWGFFMVDYILRGTEPMLLEMTPRPGGDAIPDLAWHAVGLDTLGLYLDFMCGALAGTTQAEINPRSFASLNFYAREEGTITHLDGSRVTSLPHVKALILKKGAGDRVSLPPGDYDNRLLGYCILDVTQRADLLREHRALKNLLEVSIRGEPVTPAIQPLHYAPRGLEARMGK